MADKTYPEFVNAATSVTPLNTDLMAVVRDGTSKQATIGSLITGTQLVVAASDASDAAKSHADYVCDGVDDDVQINAAFNAMTAQSDGRIAGEVYLTGGIYNISDTIHLYRTNSNDYIRLSLRGEGMNATKIRLADNSNCDMVDCVIPAASTTIPAFFGIRDLVLNGNRSNQTSGHGIFTQDNSAVTGVNIFDCNISHVMAIQCKDDGFHMEDCWGFKLDNNITEFCGNDGCYFDGNQVYMSNHFSAYNVRYGMYQDADLSMFNNIFFYVNGSDGVYLKGSTNSFSSININAYGDDGEGTTNVGSYGLYVSDFAVGNTFAGVRIAGYSNSFSGTGLWCRGVNNSFSGMTITGSYGAPIYIHSRARGNTFSGIISEWGVNADDGISNNNRSNDVNGITFTDLVTAAGALKTVGLVNLENTAADAVTLADGTVDGQRVNICMTKYSSATVTLTIAKHETSSPEVCSFDASTEYITLIWDKTNDYWVTHEANCTFP